MPALATLRSFARLLFVSGLAFPFGCGTKSEAGPAGVDDAAKSDATIDAASYAGGAAIWGRAFGTLSDESAMAVSTAPDGSTYVLAVGRGTTPVRQGALIPSDSTTGTFLTKYDPAGVPSWTRYMGIGIGHLAVTASGPIVVGNGPRGALVVSALDRAGAVQWSQTYPTTSSDDVGSSVRARCAVDVEGNLAVIFDLAGAITLDKPYGSMSGGSHTRIVARFHAGGSLGWARTLGEDASSLDRVTFLPDGNLAVAGTLQSYGTIGDLGLSTVGTEPDVFVAVFTPFGASVWAKTFGDADPQRLQDLASDGAGAIVLADTTNKPPTGGPTVPDTLRLRKLDPTGAEVWLRVLPVTRLVLASTTSADLLVAGSFVGAIDLGAGKLGTPMVQDSFLARLDADGHARWSRRLFVTGGYLTDASFGAASLSFVGTFHGDWAFDTGHFLATGTGLGPTVLDDVFVGRLGW